MNQVDTGRKILHCGELYGLHFSCSIKVKVRTRESCGKHNIYKYLLRSIAVRHQLGERNIDENIMLE
jgi:hypothetical protein